MNPSFLFLSKVSNFVRNSARSSGSLVFLRLALKILDIILAAIQPTIKTKTSHIN